MTDTAKFLGSDALSQAQRSVTCYDRLMSESCLGTEAGFEGVNFVMARVFHSVSHSYLNQTFTCLILI